MRRVNLSTSITVAGDATSGSVGYFGFTSPTVTEIGDNPDVTVASDGTFTLAAALEAGSEALTVKVQDAAGYFIQGPVTIQGDGAPSNYAQIGYNLGSINNYAGLYPFANVCWNMGIWEQVSGSGAFSQVQGAITAAVGSDIFQAHPSTSGIGMPDGTYTVYNPAGVEIAIGHGSSQNSLHAWTTATSFTFTYNPSSGDHTSTANGMWVYVKGSLSDSLGALSIILPGHTTSWNAGDIWNADFISFHQGLNTKLIRFMDWTVGSNNFEIDWSDRSLPGKINITNPSAANQCVVPWEYCIDLCNRLGADAWFSVSPRATPAYMASCAALWGSDLDAPLVVWPEPGNETWNPGLAWIENFQWVGYLNHTKRVATANPTPDSWTLASHGLSEGQLVRCFSSRPDFAAGNKPSGYLRGGTGCYVHVLDANTFQLRQDSASGATIPVYPLAQQQVFVNPAETSFDNNGNHADLTVALWDAFDAAMGSSRVYHVVASQAASTGVTSSRFSGLGTNASRADGVAVAPYFNGPFFGGLVVTDSGQFSPRFWSNVAGTWYFAVYATGTTKTMAQVMAGTGAINHQVVADPQQDWWDIGTGAAVTGLTNGTSYKVYFVFTHTGSGRSWKIGQEVVATASHTLVEFHDTDANQALRGVLDAIGTNPTAHIAASGGKQLTFYEFGLDLNSDMPAEMATRRDTYQETAVCAESMRQMAYIRTLSGFTKGCYFSDAGVGTFSLASDYSDTADERYQVFDVLNGRVAVRTALAMPDLVEDGITADPGSYPANALTLPNASLTYTIIKGNEDELFDFSGANLRLLSDPGINWAGRTGYLLNVAAYDGYTTDTFDIYVRIGAGWWQADAVVDIDYVNDRAWINGTAYASVAAAVTAGAIVLSGGVYRVNLTGLLNPGFTFAAKGTTYSSTVVGQNPRYLAALDDASTSNLIYLTQSNDGGTAKLISAVIRSGTDQTSGAIKTAVNAGTSASVVMAGRYSANDVAVTFDGATVVTDTSVTMPTPTQLVIGNRHDGTRAWLGSIDRIVVINDTLGNGILQTLLR